MIVCILTWRRDTTYQVFFCTPVPATTKQLNFRPSRGSDYFGSYLRQHVFQHLPKREIAFEVILGRSKGDDNPEAKVLLTDKNNPLSKWQDEDTLNFWKCEFIDF